MDKPSPDNCYQQAHVDLLVRSYQHWTGKAVLGADNHYDSPALMAEAVFTAPFALVSHNTAAEPVFNYGNLTALQLFALEWEQFTQLPSRQSAEPVTQTERARLLAQVTSQGYIDHYEGVRIASTGQRFVISNAVVWNVVDNRGQVAGQAAMFHSWIFL